MFSMDPKVLRAEARRLNALARTIEMAQDPQKYMQKQVRSKVNGMKRKARNQVIKKIGI
jgi:hypothetical protein